MQSNYWTSEKHPQNALGSFVKATDQMCKITSFSERNYSHNCGASPLLLKINKRVTLTLSAYYHYYVLEDCTRVNNIIIHMFTVRFQDISRTEQTCEAVYF